MFVDLEQLSMRPTAVRTFFEPEAIQLESGNAKLAGAVEVDLTLKAEATGVRISGAIMAPLVIECVRCLKSCEISLAVDTDVEFLTEEEFGTERERELRGDEMDADVLTGGSIDILALVREQILLSMPERFVCGPECRGICEKCGADLNLLDCECDRSEIDARWAPLLKIK